jgi:hypothetical protein
MRISKYRGITTHNNKHYIPLKQKLNRPITKSNLSKTHITITSNVFIFKKEKKEKNHNFLCKYRKRWGGGTYKKPLKDERFEERGGE